MLSRNNSWVGPGGPDGGVDPASPMSGHAPHSPLPSPPKPAKLGLGIGLSRSNSQGALAPRRRDNASLAQQVLQRNLAAHKGKDQPASLPDRPQSARELGLSIRVTQEDYEDSESRASTPLPYARAFDSPMLGARASTPNSSAAFASRSEQLWLHYAGRDAKHLSRKGLRQLSSDVFDEFVERLRDKVRELAEQKLKPGQEVDEARLEADLHTDLPYLLPAQSSVSGKPPTRDDYIRYIQRFSLHELVRMNVDGGDKLDGRSSRPQTPSQAPRISKLEFIAGWKRCHDLLFTTIQRMQKKREDGKGPCHLM